MTERITSTNSKSKFTKLEADLSLSRNIISELSQKLFNVEWKDFANEQNLRTESLEVLSIVPSATDSEQECPYWMSLSNAPIESGLDENYRSSSSKGKTKKVILKFNQCKGALVPYNKKRLKDLDPETVTLPYDKNICMNESL